MATTIKTWKCKCGKLQIKLHGDPVCSWNCHCHSCTAASRYITDKYHGTTQLSDATNRTGSAMSLWHMKDIDFFQGSPHNNLGYVKIGEHGKFLRSYTKCCGTQAFVAGNNLPFSYRHFNRNCLYNEDGTRFEPEVHNIPNIMVSYAFDPTVIDEPKYNYVPLANLWMIVSSTIKTKLGMESIGKIADEPSMLVKAQEYDEVVPITWE